MRIALPTALCVAANVVATCAIAQAEECTPTAERHAVQVTHPGGSHRRPAVSGENDFYQSLDNGWVFALQRAETGWQIRLYDGVPEQGAVDLTQLTSPARSPQPPGSLRLAFP
ncbi:MAG: hypothetical protein AAGA68_23140 [Pseudomonadota bacterium]